MIGKVTVRSDGPADHDVTLDFDARERAEYEHWVQNPMNAAKRLTALVDYLDEFGIGMGDHSDRPLLIAARDMVASFAEGR